jgi:hypothetical protein
VQCFIKIVAPYINPGDRPTPEAKPDFNPNRGNSPGSTGGMPGLLTPIPPFVTPSFGLPTQLPGFNEGGGLALPPTETFPTGAPDGLIPPYFASGGGGNPADILTPGGIPIGAEGSRPDIRVLPGGFDAARDTFDQLTQGGTVNPNTNYKGIQIRRSDGGIVGLRTEATRSPGTEATVDVNIPGIPIKKIKFIP